MANQGTYLGLSRETTNKEQILTKIRNAVFEKQEALFKDIDLRTDTHVPINEEDGEAVTFVKNFQDNGGIFMYLENEYDFADCMRQLCAENGWLPLWCGSPAMQDILSRCGIEYTTDSQREPKQQLVSITDCDYLIAQTGSIVLTDNLTPNSQYFTMPDVHIVFARMSQIMPNLKVALNKVKEKYSNNRLGQISIISGMSRTYDIEQTEVRGVFGPKQIAVFLVED